MAMERGFSGFETGDLAGWTTLGNNGLLTGLARSGEFSLDVVKSTATTGCGVSSGEISTPSIAADDLFRCHHRFAFMVLAYPSATNHSIGGVVASTRQFCDVQMSTTGTIRLAGNIGTTSYTSAVLALDTWYLVSCASSGQNFPGTGLGTGFGTFSANVVIRTEAGAVVVSLSLGPTDTAALTTISGRTLGAITGVSAPSSTAHFRYDDSVWRFVTETGITGSGTGSPEGIVSGSVGDLWRQDTAAGVRTELWLKETGTATTTGWVQTLFALPSADHVTGVLVTGQSTNDDFATASHWWKVSECPMQPAATGASVSSATLNATTLYLHKTAAQLNIHNIAAIQLWAPGTGTSAQRLVFDNIEYARTFSAGTAGADASVLRATGRWTGYTDAEFDAMTFGVKVTTATTLTLHQTMLEVLHGTATVASDVTTDSYRCKRMTYTGNATTQLITGLGFRPHLMFIRPKNTTDGQGFVWHRSFGGTNGLTGDSTVTRSEMVLEITDDGFRVGSGLGTSNDAVNETAVVYEAMCFRDGGGHADGPFLVTGTYLGNGVDSRDITVAASGDPAFDPDIVGIFGNTIGGVWKTSLMTVGDYSHATDGTTTTTDMIQALAATGFQVGTSVRVNNNLTTYYWLALRDATAIGALMDFGNYDGDGLDDRVITGLAFKPAFLLAGGPTTNGVYWWSAYFHTAVGESSLWRTNAAATAGIETATATTFTVDALANAAATGNWWLALEQGMISPLPAAVAVVAGDYGPLGWEILRLDFKRRPEGKR